MKKLLFLLAFVTMSFGQAHAAFYDVPADHPNFKAISWLEEQGVVEGYKNNAFRPDSLINRAEFLKMLYEANVYFLVKEDKSCIDMSGGYEYVRGNCYYEGLADIDNEEWYAVYVNHALSERIIEGYPDGNFKPDNQINYAEAAKILQNMYYIVDHPYAYGDGISVPDFLECEVSTYANREGYYDWVDEEAWYFNYVKLLDQTCISNFDSNAIVGGKLDANAKISRADMAELLYRTKSVVDDYETIKYSENQRPKAVKYCRSEPLMIGGYAYPSAREYSHLRFLGEILTVHDYCGGERMTENINGVEYGQYSEFGNEAYGYKKDMRVILKDDVSAAALKALEKAKFVCSNDDCSEYYYDPKVEVVSISELVNLKEFVDEFERDDCVSCG